MGFFKRLLGLETSPGEPASLTDATYQAVDWQSGRTRFIYFYHLWCSSCQVMGGLLNEVGPGYAGDADFFKLDVTKNPAIASRFEISGVPAIVAIREGRAFEKHTGLVPIDQLKDWIESVLSPAASDGTAESGDKGE